MTLARRSFLRMSAAIAAGLATACSHPAGQAAAKTDEAPSAARTNVLLVYFSRAGENYFNGGRKTLTVGNTAVVAGMIREALGCDVLEIKPSDPYSARYDDTVARNVREQNENARPTIANMPASIAAYDTILIGSPIWNVRVPRIMLTFAEHFDFTGKTVHPFTTYAMSGLGRAVDEYTAACSGAKIGEALAVRGEEVAGSRAAIDAWLSRIVVS